jgi:hypothetical protein
MILLALKRSPGSPRRSPASAAAAQGRAPLIPPHLNFYHLSVFEVLWCCGFTETLRDGEIRFHV